MLEVYNKTDLLGAESRIERDEQGKPIRVWLSARRNEGLELLYQALNEILGGDIVETTIDLSPSQGRLRARLYSLGAVQSEELDDNGDCHLHLRLPAVDWYRFLSAESLPGSPHRDESV